MCSSRNSHRGRSSVVAVSRRALGFTRTLKSMEDGAAAIKPPDSKEEEEEEEEEVESQKDENVLIFLDSLDGYIALLDSLTSTLRKGWLDLASARHSMGSSRISSSLLDLKVQSAATTLQVSELINEPRSEIHYTLSKWGSLRDDKYSAGGDISKLQKSHASQLRHRGSSHLQEGSQESHPTSTYDAVSNGVDNNIQRERSKSLAVFGTLVSPKLRSAQVSFETALETIVEIANMRSSMLSAFCQLQREESGQVEVPENRS